MRPVQQGSILVQALLLLTLLAVSGQALLLTVDGQILQGRVAAAAVSAQVALENETHRLLSQLAAVAPTGDCGTEPTFVDTTVDGPVAVRGSFTCEAEVTLSATPLAASALSGSPPGSHPFPALVLHGSGRDDVITVTGSGVVADYEPGATDPRWVRAGEPGAIAAAPPAATWLGAELRLAVELGGAPGDCGGAALCVLVLTESQAAPQTFCTVALARAPAQGPAFARGDPALLFIPDGDGLQVVDVSVAGRCRPVGPALSLAGAITAGPVPVADALGGDHVYMAINGSSGSSLAHAWCPAPRCTGGPRPGTAQPALSPPFAGGVVTTAPLLPAALLISGSGGVYRYDVDALGEPESAPAAGPGSPPGAVAPAGYCPAVTCGTDIVAFGGPDGSVRLTDLNLTVLSNSPQLSSASQVAVRIGAPPVSGPDADWYLLGKDANLRVVRRGVSSALALAIATAELAGADTSVAPAVTACGHDTCVYAGQSNGAILLLRVPGGGSPSRIGELELCIVSADACDPSHPALTVRVRQGPVGIGVDAATYH